MSSPRSSDLPPTSPDRRDFLRLMATGAAAAAVARLPGADAPSASGANYAPAGRAPTVVKPGEFTFAAAFLDHGHINGMAKALREAGAGLKWVYDSDPKKVADFQKLYPEAKAARSFEEILDDPAVQLVAAAAVPNLRGGIGCRVMQAGKDYFTDKTPFTAFDQFEAAKKVVRETKRRYFVYFSERLHNESAMYATQLVKDGAVGRVLQVLGLGPHRLGTGRPAWFFEHEKYGGILCDIGSHQFEQFLTYGNVTDASVMHAIVANHGHRDTPELEDFGEASLLGNNGATNYIRVDWFTPPGLSTWGDGRTFILGDKGYIELRKYVDIARDRVGDHVYLVDQHKEQRFDVAGQVGFPFFGDMILDCLNRTEKAMTQDHIFKAAELCLKAQAAARKIE
ncbi:MAG TPA: Gfo/Idh/MocA family oxidoreductase [Candidatus Didemnitutus sp.]|nr:Gfo/Idh/MocA family oxidoreductase [Candidatus Didemnitutus sp.]